MKKRISRLVCLIMALLVAVALFAGCKDKNKENTSSGSGSQSDSSKKETDVMKDYEGKWNENIPAQMDLDDFEMVFAIDREAWIMPEKGQSENEDMIRDSMKDLEDRYNCDFEVKIVQDWNVEVLSALLSGDEFAHVLMPEVWRAGTMVSAKVCLDWNTDAVKKYVHTEDPWWNDTMAYASNINGKVYAGACNIQNYAELTEVCFFNKSILKEIGSSESELYKMYTDKTWTWEAFRTLAKKAVKDLNDDGKMDENDQWGFLSSDYDALEGFLSSAKCSAIVATDGKKPTYNYSNSFALKTLTTLNDMYTSDGTYFVKANSQDENGNWRFYQMFATGQSLFSIMVFRNASQQAIRDMEDEIGIMPLPLGPKDGGGWQSEYASRVNHNFRLCLIPANNTETENTALLLEAIAYTRWQAHNALMDVYGTLYLYDDTAEAIAKELYNWSSFEISQFVYGVNGMAFFQNVSGRIPNLAKVANFDIATTFTSVEQSAQIIIDEYFTGKVDVPDAQ